MQGSLGWWRKRERELYRDGPLEAERNGSGGREGISLPPGEGSLSLRMVKHSDPELAEVWL